MYFTKFELKNIQKHEDLTINLVNGLNVLHGASGRGKSAVLRGLMWVYGLPIPVKDLQREGTKQCYFEVTLDNGIKIKRIKSASKNRYEVKYPDKEEIVSYNKIGKTIPKEVADILMKTELEVDGQNIVLNFQQQKEPYFFLGEKASFRVKLLNKLTGSDVLDRTVHSYNKDLHAINRDYNSLNKQIEEHDEKLKEINFKKKLQKDLLDSVALLARKIQELKEKEKQLTRIQEDYNYNKCQINDVVKVLSGLKFVDNVETILDLSEKYDIMYSLSNKLKENETQIKETLNRIKSLNTVDNIIVIEDKIRYVNSLLKLQKNISEVKTVKKILNDMKILDNSELSEIEYSINKYNDVSKLSSYKEKLEQITYRVENCKKNIEETQETLKSNKIKYKKIIKDMGTCPVCQQNITDKCIEMIEL